MSCPTQTINASATSTVTVTRATDPTLTADDCTSYAGRDHIIQVNIPCAGQWTFQTCGGSTNFDTYLFLGTSCCDASLGSNDDNCGLQSSVTITTTGAQTVFARIEGFNGATGTYTLSVSKAAGTPQTYGSNTWNVNVYDGGGFNTYLGYYTNATTAEFNMGAQGMGVTQNPSVISGYQGCSPGNDNWSAVALRQGFPCNRYDVQIQGHDDNFQVIIDANGDGTNDFTSTNYGCCNTGNGIIWTGILNASSRVELRMVEGAGDAYFDVNFNAIGYTAIQGGTIAGTITNGMTICSGGDPGDFLSSGNASNGTVPHTNGGNYTYDWELSTVSGASGFTSLAYSDQNYNPGALTQTTWFRRKATDKCGNIAYSNVVLVQVVATPAAPTATMSPASTSVCEGLTLTLTNPVDNGGGTGTCNFEYSVNGGAWSTTVPSVTAAVGSNVISIRKACSGLACGNSTQTDYTWTGVQDPVSPGYLFSNVTPFTAVCVGTIINVTFNAGVYGISCVDEYQYSVDGGTSWTAYTPGADITATTVGQDVIVQARRNCSGDACDGAAETFTTQAAWTVVGDPALSISAAQSVCANDPFTLNAALTGGVGCTITWEYSTNNSNWFPTGSTGATFNGNVSVNTYYRAYTSCNTGCDPSTSNVILVTVTGAGTVALAGATTTLNIYCDDPNGWTYYLDGTGNALFAIRWAPDGSLSGANAAAKAASSVEVTLGSMTSATSSSYGTWAMGRYWNVNAPAFDEAVDVRFYFDPAEKTAVENAMTSFTSASNNVIDEGFIWFKTVSGAYTPALVDYNGVDPYNTIELTGSEGDENSTHYVEFSGLASFSGGSGATGVGKGNALPVELMYFTGTKAADHNLLAWATATEDNAAFYDVQRSKDGVNFQSIGRVNAVGNALYTNTYNYKDEQPLSGISYYRLKMVDTDESTAYSNIISLERAIKGTELVQLFPNPTQSSLNYELEAQDATEVTVKIMDNYGRILHNELVQLGKGRSMQSLDVSQLTNGLYYIQISCCDGDVITQKFVKD